MRKLIAGISSLAIVFTFFAFVSSAGASQCTVTVQDTDPSGSIQTAINNASSGDRICLDGTFNNEPTVTIGTSNITVKSASPGILDGGDGPAFRLADGVSSVTIEGLEIRNRTGFRGGGVEAWDRTTSNITIQNNNIHDNTYNGVLVGSEGGFVHKNWRVIGNTVNDHGFAGIELTNCENCIIADNSVDPSFIGILVQARNTIGGSVHINGVNVSHNTINDAVIGVYVLTYEGLTGPPFASIGATSLLTNVNVNNNTINNSGFAGVLYRGYNPGSTANNGRINNNVIDCTPTGATGVDVRADGASGAGTVKNVKVVNNNFSGCSPNVSNTGTGTKLPPGPGPF